MFGAVNWRKITIAARVAARASSDCLAWLNIVPRLPSSLRRPVGMPRCLPGSGSAGEAPQQAELAIEQGTCLRAVDLPAPRVCQVERAADLAGAAVRHVEEAPGIASAAAIALGEVEHDATGGALDLVVGLVAMLAKLSDHRAQGASQIQSDAGASNPQRARWIASLCSVQATV